jgi:hypothetical protein
MGTGGGGGGGVTGPFERALDGTGKKGKVNSAGDWYTGALVSMRDFVAITQTELCCADFDEEPKVSKGARCIQGWRGSIWTGGRSSLRGPMGG